MKGTRHRTILSLLKSRLIRGVYTDRLPSERKLAAELGTNRLTLAMALTHLEALGLIERRERRGDFVVPREKRLESHAPMTVLLSQGVWSHRSGKTASNLVYVFEQALRSHGLDLVLVRHYVEDIDQAVEEMLTRLKSPACAGACLIEQPVDAARALRLAEAAGPVVLVDWETEDPILPTVVFDNAEAGRIAAGHLLRLGHRRIVFVDPIGPLPFRLARAAAAADTARRLGGVCRDVRAAEISWRMPDCVRILQSDDRPTAVICAESSVATEMAAAAAQLGLHVPRDLSLLHMGSGRQEESSFTYIDFDYTPMGERAVELLLQTEPGMAPRTVLVPVRLVDHGTTAPPATEPK